MRLSMEKRQATDKSEKGLPAVIFGADEIRMKNYKLIQNMIQIGILYDTFNLLKDFERFTIHQKLNYCGKANLSK